MPTVVELSRRRAELRPADHAYWFVADGSSDVALTYAELDAAARAVAGALAGRGAAGQPVLLLYPPGPDYVAGFLGCLYAGAVAVPAYPPDPARWSRTLPRLRALVADCGARVALSVSGLAALAPGLAAEAPELAGLDWLATDTLPDGAAEAWEPPGVDGDSAALLQYTSGSTGAPRGVLLSHANLLHNAGLVQAGFGTTPDAVGVSWLPPYHDMGLIGGVLQPLYAGFPIALMSPLTFLQRPMAWLETISRLGATMSGGPNFAFDLCVRRSTPQQRAALDLSRWAVAFCGAEPVRAATLDRFAGAFAPAGFRREAFYPCYGLAEATLIVTGGSREDPPGTVGGQVGCGRPLGGQRLEVVDPEAGTPCPPGVEGEIWVSGPSVAQGYWRRPAETAATFHARLPGEPDLRWLRTGDLGFLDPTGELAVTGRIKDLIIVRGRNLHPQDLEHAVERVVAGVRPGATAAVPVVRDGEERVGVVCELSGDGSAGDVVDEVVAAVRRVVAETAEVAVASVVLLRRGQVPKTSSGKLQRYACRRSLASGDWRTGSLGVLARWDEGAAEDGDEDEGAAGGGPGAADRAETVAGLVAGILGSPPGSLPGDQPLTGLGLDSLRAVELQGAVEERYGVRPALAELLTGMTLDQLAALTTTAGPAPAGPPAPAPAGVPTPDPPPQEGPASDGQRALWLIQRWAPESTAYQISRAARIRSALDAGALERAFRAVVERHPALRTCLPARDGTPVRRVTSGSGPVLVRHDVAGLDGDLLHRRVQADADRGFDLERGPLFRASLYTRAATDHVLLLSLHHTITDFWSLSVLVDELLSLYTGYATGRPVTLPAAEAGDGPGRAGGGTEESAEDRLRFWRETLAGAPPALELPTTYPRPRLQTWRGATHPLRLDAAALQALDGFATGAGLTRFVVLTAAFATVLARYAGEEEVVVGAPTAGRGAGERHRLGYFANPVPLRIRVPPGGTFRELATAVRRTVVDALDHAVPFPRLVEALRPARDPARSPLTQVMVVTQRAPSGRPDLGAFAVPGGTPTARLGGPGGLGGLGGLDVAPYPLAERGSAFDLSLSTAEVGGELLGSLTYCTDLFDEAAVARLSGHFTTLLARAVSEPDRPLETLDLMDSRERATVLARAAGPVLPLPEPATLHDRFAACAARQPEATALVSATQTLTYAELDERAGRLAARLRTGYGVGPGAIVGVHLPPGAAAIVAFWAALASGGAYLPLPPDLPAGRLEWMLGDARPLVVVTDAAHAAGLPTDVPRLYADQPLPPAAPAAEATEAAPAAAGRTAGPDDVAYVLFTSGSTGRPKGAQLTHRGACNLAGVLADGLEIGPTSRVLQYAASAYDVHVGDIVSAHLAGAALHVPPPEARVPGQPLVDVLAGRRITHVTFSPSVLAALPDTSLPDLTHLLCGGETCPAEVVARWAPGRRFRNAYGPTETTVCVTWTECRPDGRRPSIGAPMPNTRVHVLDHRMAPVPVGVPGELYIGGVCVGPGYLNRTELTAQRFVVDPFDPDPAARLYRTGDRGRWLPDGTLDILGRLDDQVKIRGVRVEPGEVEVRMRELLGLREVAVVAAPGPAGTDELVAYLVAAGPRRPVAELRGLLRAELPEPWLPAAFVHLDALPLNPSGKLDRRALPPPEPADRGLSGQLAPRTELERVVAQVWASALGQATVGVRDHFFDELGGSSLLVGQVTGELSRRLDREVPVTYLFEHPTVEALARRLGDSGPAAGQPADGSGGSPEEQAERRRRALARRRRSVDDA